MIEKKGLGQVIFAAMGVLLIALTGCSSETEGIDEKLSYDFITGEYETSYGRLIITEDENYILTEDREKLETNVVYNYDGTADVTLTSLTSDIISRTASVTAYYFDNNKKKITMSCTLICNDTREFNKIFIDKNRESVRSYKETIHYYPNKHSVNYADTHITKYEAKVKIGNNEINLLGYVEGKFSFSYNNNDWTIDSPFSYPEKEIEWL